MRPAARAKTKQGPPDCLYCPAWVARPMTRPGLAWGTTAKRAWVGDEILTDSQAWEPRARQPAQNRGTPVGSCRSTAVEQNALRQTYSPTLISFGMMATISSCLPTNQRAATTAAGEWAVFVASKEGVNTGTRTNAGSVSVVSRKTRGAQWLA